jgi:hypothetical protein
MRCDGNRSLSFFSFFLFPLFFLSLLLFLFINLFWNVPTHDKEGDHERKNPASLNHGARLWRARGLREEGSGGGCTVRKMEGFSVLVENEHRNDDKN